MESVLFSEADLMSVLERPLAGKHHRHLRLCLVAGLDGLEVPHRAAGLQDRRHPLPDADIGAITEGEEGVGDHHRAGDAPLVPLHLDIDRLFLRLVNRGCRRT